MISLHRQFQRMRNALNQRMTPTGEREQGVAMLSAILFMIMMAGISVVLLSLVLNQRIPTYLSQKNTKTINSAQAGMQTALGIIRSVADAPDVAGKVYGDLAELPCTLTGTVNGQSDGNTYSVTVKYFKNDPTGMTSAWQTTNAMPCSASSGLATQPGYALIVSQGLAPAVPGVAAATTGNRTLSAIYKFKVSNVNTAGGRIYDYNRGWCLQAVSATTGSNVRFIAAASCTNDALELWIYDTDYQIKLAGTTVGGLPGLCITGPAVAGQPTQNATLQPCRASTDPARWNELWSWQGQNAWSGQQQNIAAGNSGYCLATGFANGTALNGKFLLVSTNCNGGFSPNPEVGAGAAGYGTHQIVNYKEFGRCVDVTGENISAGYMISYPCKQDPTGTGVNLLWNHKWYYTEPSPGVPALNDQQIYVYYQDNLTKKYCLTAPATGGGSYPVFATCDNNNARQKWDRVYDTGTYLSSYLFVDSYGRCLMANSADKDGSWSKLTIASCNGSDAQKWNAPPSYTDSTVGGFREVAP